MELFVVVRVETDRKPEEIANEIRANLEYENVEVKAIVASQSLGDAVIEALQISELERARHGALTPQRTLTRQPE